MKVQIFWVHAMKCMSAQTRPPKEFGGMESEPLLTPREKSPLPEAQRRVEPLHCSMLTPREKSPLPEAQEGRTQNTAAC